MALARQVVSYGWIGVVTAVAHYAVLIGLVEAAGVGPVTASLAGFAVGAAVSYTLNRRFTFAATRSHAEATWRFGVVALAGFVLTGLLMALLTGRLGLPYLPAQVLTTLMVMAVSFLGHKFWSFGEGT